MMLLRIRAAGLLRGTRRGVGGGVGRGEGWVGRGGVGWGRGEQVDHARHGGMGREKGDTGPGRGWVGGTNRGGGEEGHRLAASAKQQQQHAGPGGNGREHLEAAPSLASCTITQTPEWHLQALRFGQDGCRACTHTPADACAPSRACACWPGRDATRPQGVSLTLPHPAQPACAPLRGWPPTVAALNARTTRGQSIASG